jgi:hypothetical protein
MALLGCGSLPVQSELASSAMLLYIIAAAVAFLVIMLATYYSRRKKRQSDLHLKKRLIEDQSGKSCTATKDESQSYMYVDVDMAWKPPFLDPSALHEIPPVRTMSTVSTARFAEDRTHAHGDEESIVGLGKISTTSNQDSFFSTTEDPTPVKTPTSIVNALDNIDDQLISPIPSSDNDSSYQHK